MLVPDCRSLMLPTPKTLADGKALVTELSNSFHTAISENMFIAERLRQEGLRVEIHDDHLPPDTPDEEWRGLTEAEA